MKKLALFLAVLFITGMFLSTLAFSVEIPLRVVVNGDELIFPDAKPFIDLQGRTQTPARFIGEALGATASWDGKAKKATFEKGSKKLILYIGKKEYEFNGQKKQMDTVALLKNDRTFVPARYVSEAFGATVRWESAIKTVYIETNKVPQPTVTPGGTENIAGFIVPRGIELIVASYETSNYYDSTITIDYLKRNVEKQKNDAEKILLQRFSQDIVSQIMNHVRPKMKPEDIIEQKELYDAKVNQYIVIEESTSDTLTICIYKKGLKPVLN
jgi:hypothetical protein